jgi:transketolase C-terminal domain/subunit
MSLTETVREQLLALPRNEWPLVAAAADLSESTLMKVAYRASPTHNAVTIERLAAALADRKS